MYYSRNSLIQKNVQLARSRYILKWRDRQNSLFLGHITAKNRHLAVRAILASKKIFCNIYKKSNAYVYFQTKIVSWVKFKGN